MTTSSRSLFIAILATLALASCKSEQNAENPQTPQTEEAATERKTPDAQPEASVGVLNANLATAEQLAAVGIAADMAAKIIDNRPFLSLNDLNAQLADGLDREALYQKIFVPLNLNTTPEADFKQIPGVGDKMAHEFEEYRPYSSVAQFRKEIGKYVDETQVAHYLNYVFVPIELNTASTEDIQALPGVGERMTHEFEEYRPYTSMEQFRQEIGKYVDDKELDRLERLVYLNQQ